MIIPNGSKTLILQSCRQPIDHEWLSLCLQSVRHWAETHQYDYRLLDDELFSPLAGWVIEKTKDRKVIATDLARLYWCAHFLRQNYETVVWMDSDFLIFNPGQFTLPDTQSLPERYQLGREVWIQEPETGTSARPGSLKPRAYVKVHNAYLLFRRGNHFLDFYLEHAERLLEKTSGPMPPQFIGPKLLTAIHNVVQCPVHESAGMLSPLIMTELGQPRQPATSLYKRKIKAPTYAANLCHSLFQRQKLTQAEMLSAIDYLLDHQKHFEP